MTAAGCDETRGPLFGAPEPAARFEALMKAGLRTNSGSPHVRAWLHAQDPYRWEPAHDLSGNVSCSACARGTEADSRAAWEVLTANTKPQDHPLVQLPRHQWPSQR